MIQLVNKENLIHDLYTLDILLEDMEKVANYINNYETLYWDNKCSNEIFRIFDLDIDKFL